MFPTIGMVLFIGVDSPILYIKMDNIFKLIESFSLGSPYMFGAIIYVKNLKEWKSQLYMVLSYYKNSRQKKVTIKTNAKKKLL